MGNKRELIDREIFFGNPEIAAGNISPDGQRIAFMKTYEGIMNLYVKNVDQPFDEAKVLTKSKSPIMGYLWTKDSKYILFVNDKNGDENFNIFSVDPSEEWSEKSNPNLTPLDDVNVQIYKVSRVNPDKIWIGINDRDKAWHDLYELQISTRKLTMLFQNDQRITGWEFDWDEKIRLAYRTDENGHSEILTVDNLSDFKLLYTTNLQESAQITGWDETNTNAFIVSNKGETDLSTLYSLDISTGVVKELESDPENEVDFGNLIIHQKTREIIGTIYVGDKVRRYWKNQQWKDMFSKLEGKFSNKEVSIISHTEDYKKLLISVGGDRYASEVWMYDWEKDTLLHQYTVRPELKAVEDRLSPMNPISYDSSDGLRITGYLTLPVSAQKKENLPCVILVHGGPKGPRDYWGYNGEVQFLADRGYAVLQPNFRASGGYGKRFLNAGDKQWGRLMQDDITWGVKYLIDQGIADPEKIAIMGGSYGGYATLAGLAFTPDVYACGVDIVGPSNLFTLLDSIPPYWEAGRKWLYEMTGDPSTEEGQELLKNASPLFSASKIIKPLMIVQGANDPRVKQAESEQIVAALKENGQSYSYLLAEDEGHGFRKPLNRRALHAEIEKFFATHLGGEYQEEVNEEVSETLKLLTQLDIDQSEMIVN
ncbi:MAG: S9 family peptidase [Saprospiraceae bacterium]|nr:S9 family peptidase [Saprospiraceae bacterium]